MAQTPSSPRGVQREPNRIRSVPHAGTAGSVDWGDILGTLADQLDLAAALAAKLDDSQASAFGLTVLAAVNAAAAKTLLALVKADVGLGNVDNTSDANKPVSTAQQTALDLKLNIASYTAADVLAKILTVDGAGSGLDADTLDGLSSAAFQPAGSYQPLDTDLTAIAALTSAADKLPYATGSGTWALTDLTSVGRTLLSQTTQALMRTTGLGLGTAATVNTGTSGATIPLLNAANTWSATQTFAGSIFGAAAGKMYGYSDATFSGWSSGAAFSNDGILLTGAGGEVRVQVSNNYRLRITTAATQPFADNTYDFGIVTERWKKGWFMDLNVDGLVQCDSLRIDIAPVAGLVTATHTVAGNVNGTACRFLIAIP